MNNFNNIQSKLKEFVQKYYKNELLKGLILFSSFGVLYFIFTILIESVLWLNPTARTILFWVFIVVECLLLFNYILRPILKFIGLQKGISIEEASILIGKHFKEVDDKLLNIIQLQNSRKESELLLASIEQKSADLKLISFKRAINFGTNKKYLKYLAIPIAIGLITYISGNVSLFSQSYKRVLNHDLVYLPPAPFSFHILNNDLNVIEGNSFTIKMNTKGKVIPDDAQIYINNQSNYLTNKGNGIFEYTFSTVQESKQFYVVANGIRSKNYALTVINTPRILNFELFLDYPSYTGKKDEFIKSTGNIVVPQGTKVLWKLECINTSRISFIGNSARDFDQNDKNTFEFRKRLFKNLDYKISTNNEKLQDFEQLNFWARVIKDGYPKIDVRSDIDTITSGPVQFVGQLSDDYGINSLKLVYYNKKDKSGVKNLELPVNHSSFEEFYYVFPEGINLVEGIDYELYFEVGDNDAVNGKKYSKSKLFSYYNRTEKELEEHRLNEQDAAIKDLEESLKQNKKVEKDFKNLEESLQNKSEMNWNDQKKLENFVKRQEQYQNMMQQQTEDIRKNIDQQPKSENPTTEERRQDIKKRLEEAEELAKQDELLKELERLAEKLNKEELTQKLKKLSEKNRQNERNLERILELTKRFYVEQKANQIKEKLEDLSKDQNQLSEEKENNSEKQEALNSEFEKIKKDLEELEKENKKLKKPMDFPSSKKDEERIDEDMKEALDGLENSEKQEKEEDSKSNENAEQSKSKAKKKQKSAAQKMKQMSEKMSASLEGMQGETMDEDIEMLRAILENLIEFSFQQEDLMEAFSSSNNTHPDFANRLKKQHILKEYFEHIDDSLYTLAMRQPKIGTQVFEDLSEVHYYLDESLYNFAENKYNVAISDQQFVMTSTNNIAYLLSNILNGLQNASPQMGMGKGSGDSFALPDIIQKQGESIEKMEEGIEKNGKKGKGKEEGKDGEKGKEGENGKNNGSGGGEEMNGELYEIYKEQVALRQLLEESLKDKNNSNNGVGENALKQMEQLEKDMLEKGFSRDVLNQMMRLNYELLKLQEASYKQGEDSKRKSKTGVEMKERKDIKPINTTKLWFNDNEVLIRESLPLRADYKMKVQQYFMLNDSIQ